MHDDTIAYATLHDLWSMLNRRRAFDSAYTWQVDTAPDYAYLSVPGTEKVNREGMSA